MKSFRDPTTNVLKAFGYVETNAPGDLAQDEAEDFNLEPGKWRLVGGAWQPYEDRKPAIQAQIDALERNALQNRGDRELALINMQDLARRKVGVYLEANPDDHTPAAELIQHELETTPYWVKLTELNAQIAALREQL